MSKGLFIVFEGVDGSGKSTQSKKLYEYLKNKYGKNVILTREPWGTIDGRFIRNFILQTNLTTIEQYLCFLALRASHINELIKPALKKNKIVICDRFSDSTKVYQDQINFVNNKKLYNLQDKIISNSQPDHVFLFNIDPITAFERINKRLDEKKDKTPDVFEKNIQLKEIDKRIQKYLDIAKSNFQHYSIIDAGKSPDLVFQQIINITENLLSDYRTN